MKANEAMSQNSRTIAPLRVAENRVTGTSELGRPLVVYQIGNREASLRILVISGQHGDERFGRMATVMLMNLAQSQLNLSNISLAICPDANPDGSASNTRENALGVDLNRDHQRLESRENRALHRYVRAFGPHLIIDVHNFPPRRKHLLSRRWILDQDVFLDIPTHPAIRTPLTSDERTSIFRHVQRELRPLGFSSGRYVLLRSSGKVRHSTLDLRDARNGLALRYGTMTVLLEGRQPSNDELRNGRIEVVQAQFRALVSIIRWAQLHREGLTSRPTASGRPDTLPVRFRYRPPFERVEILVRNSVTGRRHTVMLTGYKTRLDVTRTIELPSAYAVPASNKDTIKILLRQGFHFFPARYNGTIPVEVSVPLSHSTVHPSKKGTKNRREMRNLDGYAIFPVDQNGGLVLGLFLESGSAFSLRRYDDLHLAESGGVYPILRIPR